MSWITNLNQAYDTIKSKKGNGLWPISHVSKTAHVEVVLDVDGAFKEGRVRVLSGEEAATIIPATESSAGRSGDKVAPHPLCEKLDYCVEDLSHIDGENRDRRVEEKHKKKHEAYLALLSSWCESRHSHPKASAVLKYLKRNRLGKDLSQSIPFPVIFVKKDGKKSTIKVKDTFIRWRVEEHGVPGGGTWDDCSLIEAWKKFDADQSHNEGVCFMTGEIERLTNNHPKFIRHPADGAKIISSNDLTGFTFKGRFTDTKESIKQYGLQGANIGAVTSQKAHSALRWLIKRQGIKNGDQSIVAWAVSGKKIPEPWVETTKFNLDDFSETTNEQTADSANTELDHTIDIGQSYARKLKNYMAGYRANLSPTDTISIMAIDSATPGRMSITYYRECLPKEYLDQIEKWHTEFAWPQRVSKKASETDEESNSTVTWPVGVPSPSTIINSIYGAEGRDKKDDKQFKMLKKKLIERLIPSIIEGAPIPPDFVNSALNQARNPLTRKPWAWEKCLGIACSFYRGFRIRHTQTSNRKEFTMSLDTSNTSRDYLYGRLLAIADNIEGRALYLSDAERSTTALRLMRRFSDKPCSTWLEIYKQLNPYILQLKRSSPGFLANRMNELDEVMALFDEDDFKQDKRLSGEFLLGFHAERLSLRFKGKASDQNATESTEE